MKKNYESSPLGTHILHNGRSMFHTIAVEHLNQKDETINNLINHLAAELSDYDCPLGAIGKAGVTEDAVEKYCPCECREWTEDCPEGIDCWLALLKQIHLKGE